ncbi:unnamed protein product [Ostreobium quekettii]|uniref:Acyltransferase n=1 Tax=Ostreobium quekettii TaxID=121088 RepID=A0A8S1IMR3_9CHLO|nr:unnamed protein product [Ostreobium quekettii]
MTYGKTSYSDGMGPVHKQSWISYLVALATMTLLSSWMHVLGGLLLLAWRPPFGGILALLWSTVLVPASEWRAFRDGWIMRAWREYCHYSYHIEQELEPAKSYVAALFPHGVIPFGMMMTWAETPFLVPDHPCHGMVGSSLFRIPLYKHFITWMGGQPATKTNILRVLRQPGQVAVLAPGGVAEMFLTGGASEKVMLRSRKGFVRTALIAGADIIPVYILGNSCILTLRGTKFLQALSRKTGSALGLLTGRWGLPAPIPAPHPVRAVSAPPIKVEKAMPMTHPLFDQEVERLHALFMESLRALYYRHRGDFGWGDRPLEIV